MLNKNDKFCTCQKSHLVDKFNEQERIPVGCVPTVAVASPRIPCPLDTLRSWIPYPLYTLPPDILPPGYHTPWIPFPRREQTDTHENLTLPLQSVIINCSMICLIEYFLTTMFKIISPKNEQIARVHSLTACFIAST